MAEAQRDHLISISLWMLPVILPIFIGLPLILVLCRQGSKRRNYYPDWEFSLPLEIAIWALPAIVVAVLGFLLWRESFAQDPYKPLAGDSPPVEIEVVGLDWKWVFVYPEAEVASVNEVVFPAGRPVHFRVTSGTVLLSFMIPELGGQIYAMPGMTTAIYLQANEPQTFRGLNTQFNGEGFAHQKFAARAVTQEDYEAWLKETAASAPPLDRAALEELKARSVLPKPLAFGSFEGDPVAQLSLAMAHHGSSFLVAGASCGP